ncbi:MAG: NIPSNAP family protein [Novosphingobium sp.]
MYVEERVYRLKPGSIGAYFALYETRGMVPQARYIPDMLGYYASEIGDLNEVVHLWVHHSLDARERNRQQMRADPEFQAYWREVRELVVEQRTRILKPAPFFIERFERMLAAGRAAKEPE